VLAPTPEELWAHAERAGRSAVELKTAETVAAELQEVYAMWVKHRE